MCSSFIYNFFQSLPFLIIFYGEIWRYGLQHFWNHIVFLWFYGSSGSWLFKNRLKLLPVNRPSSNKMKPYLASSENAAPHIKRKSVLFINLPHLFRFIVRPAVPSCVDLTAPVLENINSLVLRILEMKVWFSPIVLCANWQNLSNFWASSSVRA